MLARRFPPASLIGFVLAAGLGLGCELVVDFDRERLRDSGLVRDTGVVFDGSRDAPLDSPLPIDAGDGGMDAPIESDAGDAGVDDAGEMDAGMEDAGDLDAGEMDSGMEMDAGEDAGTDSGPAPVDTGTDSPMLTPPDFAGCTPGMYVDMVGSSPALIEFGGAIGFMYTPSCITVQVGQTVTWMGDSFGTHPLRGAPTNPTTEVPAPTSGSSVSTTFSVAGYHGYFCAVHGTPTGGGMAGTIEVVP